MADIFISYAREDRSHAERLERGFERHRLNVWWDLESLRSGQSFNRAIQQALEQAKCVVVLWSPASVISPWVESEAYWAWQNQKLHSVRLDDAVLLPVPFNTFHARSLAGWDGGDDYAEFRRLIDDLRVVVGRQQTSESATDEIPGARASDDAQGASKGARGAERLPNATERAADVAVRSSGKPPPSELPEAPETGEEQPTRTAESSLTPESMAEPRSGGPADPGSQPASISGRRFQLPAWSKTLLLVVAISGLISLVSLLLSSGQGKTAAPSSELASKKAPTAEKEVRVLEGIENVKVLEGIENVKVLGGGDLDAAAPEQAQEPSTAAVVPEMVTIPAGSFQMGCVSGKGCIGDELPLRTVTFGKPFAIGKYEVTFAEYDQFAEATGREKPDDEGWGRGRRPVINVSWDDTRRYAAWLSKQTGKRYRLPTEAEWEYAARGGTVTPFSTGACIDTDQANYDGTSGWQDCPTTGVYREQTVEVGTLPANPKDLHEVHGNVWEWTQDCWHENYEGAPTDGSAWLEADGGDCGRRVLRGGSWLYLPGPSARPSATGTSPTAGTATSASVSPRTSNPVYSALLPFAGGPGCLPPGHSRWVCRHGLTLSTPNERRRRGEQREPTA